MRGGPLPFLVLDPAPRTRTLLMASGACFGVAALADLLSLLKAIPDRAASTLMLAGGAVALVAGYAVHHATARAIHPGSGLRASWVGALAVLAATFAGGLAISSGMVNLLDLPQGEDPGEALSFLMTTAAVALPVAAAAGAWSYQRAKPGSAARRRQVRLVQAGLLALGAARAFFSFLRWDVSLALGGMALLLGATVALARLRERGDPLPEPTAW